MDFGDIPFAMALRDSVEEIAAGLVGRIIPRSFIAEVISFDPYLRTALVRTAGSAADEPDIQVKFSPANMPSYGRVGAARGNIVTVEGVTGNYRIVEILDQSWASRGGLLPARYYNWDSRWFSWSQFFSYVGFGRGPFSTTGQFKISMPATNTVVAVHGSPNFTSTTVTGTALGLGFDLGLEGNFMSLWYEPTFQGAGESDPSRFHLVCTTEPFAIPNHWIMIAARNTLTEGNSLKIGTGENFDHWREPTSSELAGSFNQRLASSGYDSFGYRRIDTRVQFTGEMDVGGVTNWTTDIFTLPVGFRPRNSVRLAPLIELKSTFGASAGTSHFHTIPNVPAKVEVYTSGTFRMSDNQVHDNSDYLSFYGLGFDVGN